jgi:hypothetical protein
MWLHGTSMNDINSHTCFVYILLGLSLLPQLDLKYKFYWCLDFKNSYFYYNYVSNVYSLYTI